MAESIVIVNGARTPMGSFQGSLSDVRATELGSIAIKAAIERSGLKTSDIEQGIIGCVLSAGLRQGPARQAMLDAGIPQSSGATTINKLCGSGLQAVIMAHDQIKAGTNQIMLAGGMESMTNAPFISLKMRSGQRMGHTQFFDHMFYDGLEDAYTGSLMGEFAQTIANTRNITREAMDEFSITSLQRAQTATDNGTFKNEIVPVTVKTRKGDITIDRDEQPFKANIEKIPNLRPAFAKDGTITAASSSAISDGAAALIIANESTARAKGLTPQARIIAHSTHSQAPEEFTCAPIGSIQKLLDKTGWQADDVDIWEINEAFAMVAMMPMQVFNIPHEKVNIYGGACALGHPVGATGARMIVTLINALQQTGGKRGIASLCIGGGEAVGLAIELI